MNYFDDDPLWQPYELPRSQPDLSQPDLTPCTLKSWLRSKECEEEFTQLPEAAALREREREAKPMPELRRVIGHIPGYPG